MIARAAVPIAVLVIYGLYKVSTMERAPRGPMEIEDGGPLTAVDPALDRQSMDRETRALVARLETLAAQSDWDQVREAVAAAPERSREHPDVRAFRVIARVEGGEVSGEVMKELRALGPYYAADPDDRTMLDYLRLMEAELYLRLSTTPDALLRNTDRFRQLVGRQAALTPRVLRTRVELAERYEAMGDAEVEAAGRFMPDRVRLANARSLYQQGLRWVTTPEGWLELRPISTGKAVVVLERLLLRLREANAKFHGQKLPWTGADNTTWSGRKGDPPHDYPGGSW